jgi:hypothetical protein
MAHGPSVVQEYRRTGVQGNMRMRKEKSESRKTKEGVGVLRGDALRK